MQKIFKVTYAGRKPGWCGGGRIIVQARIQEDIERALALRLSPDYTERAVVPYEGRELPCSVEEMVRELG